MSNPLPSRWRVPRPEHVALAIVMAGLIFLEGTGRITLPLGDFAEYWSAGDVFLRGGNPYDPADLQESLRAAHEEAGGQVRMMWNPPWTLPVAIPASALPIRLAHTLWIAAQLGLVLLSVRMLARVYGHLDAARGPLLAAVLLFPPTPFLLVSGQICGLCLFGVAGFVYFLDRRRPIPAGLCVALTAVKPHLLLAFGLFLVLAAVVSRPARLAVLAGAGAIALSGLSAWLISPHIFADYLAALNAPPGAPGCVTVREWMVPLGAFWLRMWTAPDHFWVQFVPAAAAGVLTVIVWWKVRHRYDWPRLTPVLVLLSLLTAPYGGWPFDLILLLIPVCHAASAIGRAYGPRTVKLGLIGLAALSLAFMLAVPMIGTDLQSYVWFTPLVAAGYATALHLARRSELGQPPGDHVRLPLVQERPVHGAGAEVGHVLVAGQPVDRLLDDGGVAAEHRPVAGQ